MKVRVLLQLEDWVKSEEIEVSMVSEYGQPMMPAVVEIAFIPKPLRIACTGGPVPVDPSMSIVVFRYSGEDHRGVPVYKFMG